MRRVYFDGTYETAGHVLAAAAAIDARVLVVCSRCLSSDALRTLRALEDCMGTLAVAPRTRIGSPRRCWTAIDGIEAFFRIVADFDEQRRDELLNAWAPCHGGETCRGCAACARVQRVAAEYGIYDVLA